MRVSTPWISLLRSIATGGIRATVEYFPKWMIPPEGEEIIYAHQARTVEVSKLIQSVFMAGVKWARENPNDELIEK